MAAGKEDDAIAIKKSAINDALDAAAELPAEAATLQAQLDALNEQLAPLLAQRKALMEQIAAATPEDVKNAAIIKKLVDNPHLLRTFGFGLNERGLL